MVFDFVLKFCIVCYPDELLIPSLCSYAGVTPPPNGGRKLGVNIPSKRIQVDQHTIKLLLVDIATDPSSFPRPRFYDEASAAVIAFLKSDHDFFQSAVNHYHEFRQHIPDPTVPVVFIGLYDEPEVVSLVEG